MTRIAILIPSRNRPRLISAAITALHEMESGENEVFYYVGVDADEPQPIEYEKIIKEFKRGNLTNVDNSTIGGIWNYLAQYDKFVKNDCDIYSCMIDDAFPVSPHWDKEMVRVAKEYEAFSWYEVSAPHNVGYPTCTKAWLDKVGYIVPEHFPYWFCDTWFAEMVNFVTGKPVPVSTHMALFSKQEETQNLRDLDFWWGFFCATRGIRLREAYAIVGGEWEDFLASRKPFIDMGNARDNEFRGERIAKLENARGVKSGPSTKYLLAKKKAEEYLEANGLKIWND